MSPGVYSFIFHDVHDPVLNRAAECFSEFNIHAKGGTPFDSAANDVWSLGGTTHLHSSLPRLLSHIYNLFRSRSVLFHGWTQALESSVAR